MTQSLSFIFIILWSSSFITGKLIVENGSPFASLSFRFAIVALCFLFYSLIYKERVLVNYKNILFLVLNTEDYSEKKSAELWQARSEYKLAKKNGDEVKASNMPYTRMPERIFGDIYCR